jgi:hypothetical protein
MKHSPILGWKIYASDKVADKHQRIFDRCSGAKRVKRLRECARRRRLAHLASLFPR